MGEFIVVEFFAGIGLARVGLEAAGLSVAWANDIEADKREMYREHFGEGLGITTSWGTLLR